MSETTPTFYRGDRVRVMQTDELVERGLANRTGNVFSKWIEEGPDRRQMCRVQLDVGAFTLPASCLMKDLATV